LNQNALDNVAMVEAMAKDLAERSIHLVGMLFPQSPYFKATSVYGIEGPSTETTENINGQLKNSESSNTFFHVFDAHQMGSHDYSNGEAFDNFHLSEMGGYKFTGRFNAYVDTFLAK